jgi:archaemetzincin
MICIDVGGVAAYLAAFYHGLEVKVLPTKLRFMPWDDVPNRNARTRSRQVSDHQVISEQPIAISTGTETIRIQTRPTPKRGDSNELSAYSHQLDLNDMIDVALSVLPGDAYALLLLTDHDLYENQDDDFCCGRAFGASRVAVVSGARYQTCLDVLHGVDRDHSWPASHCKQFVEDSGAEAEASKSEAKASGRKRPQTAVASPRQYEQPIAPSQLEKAVEAHRSVDLAAVHKSSFLFRLCRTASHELGHASALTFQQESFADIFVAVFWARPLHVQSLCHARHHVGGRRHAATAILVSSVRRQACLCFDKGPKRRFKHSTTPRDVRRGQVESLETR